MNYKEKTISRKEMEQKVHAFIDHCRESGHKVTPQRIAVYKELIRSADHPSAEMLYRKIKKVSPGISLDTVNRTLLTLYEMGEASVVEGSGDVKRYDAGQGKHQHFRCMKCRRIVDFHYKPFDDIKIPASLSRKFTILRKTIYLEGICDRCGS